MLTRWDPFQEMITLRNAVDRLFDSAYGSSPTGQPVTWGLALDVIEQEDEFLVKASIPGINPDDLEITFTDNVLTIKGETKAEEEVKEANYHLRERRYGSFARSISLGSRITTEKIQANYENGVLTLHLPKAEEVKPKRIAIKPSKMIEAKAK
jgi:HSP20 family protein